MFSSSQLKVRAAVTSLNAYLHCAVISQAIELLQSHVSCVKMKSKKKKKSNFIRGTDVTILS